MAVIFFLLCIIGNFGLHTYLFRGLFSIMSGITFFILMYESFNLQYLETTITDQLVQYTYDGSGNLVNSTVSYTYALSNSTYTGDYLISWLLFGLGLFSFVLLYYNLHNQIVKDFGRVMPGS